MEQKNNQQKERNQRERKEITDRLTKDRLMRDIRRLFEYEEENDYYNPSLKILRKFRNINERK